MVKRIDVVIERNRQVAHRHFATFTFWQRTYLYCSIIDLSTGAKEAIAKAND